MNVIVGLSRASTALAKNLRISCSVFMVLESLHCGGATPKGSAINAHGKLPGAASKSAAEARNSGVAQAPGLPSGKVLKPQIGFVILLAVPAANRSGEGEKASNAKSGNGMRRHPVGREGNDGHE